MDKKKINSPYLFFEGPSKKNGDKNPDKRNPIPKDPSKEKGSRIKEMPFSDNPHHPHNEEILDGIILY